MTVLYLHLSLEPSFSLFLLKMFVKDNWHNGSWALLSGLDVVY